MMLNEIGSYLQAQGAGTLGVDMYLGLMPEQPDNCIAIFEYAGNPPALTHDGGIERPGLQVKVRNTSYPAGRSKISEVVNVLHRLSNETINGTRYIFIRANQSPEPLGRDASGRQEFVVNFSVEKER